MTDSFLSSSAIFASCSLNAARAFFGLQYPCRVKMNGTNTITHPRHHQYQAFQPEAVSAPATPRQC